MNVLRSILGGSMFISATALLLAGCAVDVNAGDEETGLENTDEVQSAFGETACGSTAPIDADETFTSWSPPSSSPTHSSGILYSSVPCPEGYIVQFHSIASGVRAYARWDTTVPTTQSVCERTRVKLNTFASDGTLTAIDAKSGVWTTLDSVNFFCVVPETIANLYKSGSTSTSRAVATAFLCDTAACTSHAQKAVKVWGANPI